MSSTVCLIPQVMNACITLETRNFKVSDYIKTSCNVFELTLPLLQIKYKSFIVNFNINKLFIFCINVEKKD